MNRASTSSWGLLGPAKDWAKAWKLGIDKVQRDVGDSACGPALQKTGRKRSQEPEPRSGSLATQETLQSMLMHTQPSPCLLTTLSKAPLLKEGWKVMS